MKATLKINNLSIGYSKKPLISKIEAEAREGELIVLLGKNGSGKSTLLKTILGLTLPISGSIIINNQSTLNWKSNQYSKHIAVVFSRVKQLPCIKVIDVLKLGRLPYHKWLVEPNSSEQELIEKVIELTNLQGLINKNVNELSDGQLQLVMIARALVQDTNLIILDEPTSHLDLENQFIFFNLLHELTEKTKKTFILATHEVRLAVQYANQIWWINNKQFHAGFTEQIAYEHKIYDRLAHKNIQFNYSLGDFIHQSKNNKIISFKSDGSSFAYWVKQAIIRNGFSISDIAKNKIIIKENTIIYTLNDVDKEYKSIQTFIQVLKEKQL